MQVENFDCPCCKVVSVGPFMPAWAIAEGFPETPRCKNDHCPTQWWNKPEKPLFEQCNDIVRVHALGMGVVLP